MKTIGKVLAILLLLSNLAIAILMLCSAYSPVLIDPRIHPWLSTTGLFFSIFLFLNIGFIAFWLVFYWKYAFISIFTLLLCGSQVRTIFPFHFRTKDVPPNCIKLLSYNVMGFNALKKDSTENMNPILNYVKKQRPDIICLQEYTYGVHPSYLREKDILKVLKKYPYYHHYTPSGTDVKGNMMAIFSKFPILTIHPIRYTSEYNGSVAYELNIRGKVVTLINNHLESNKLTIRDKTVYSNMIKNPEVGTVTYGSRLLFGKLAEASKIRSVQADSIAKYIRTKRNMPIIVCGDFNDSPISYAHYTISRGLQDAYTNAGFGFGISYNQNKFYFRIDNILISSSLKAYNCEVDNSISESDHYPIWTYIGPF